MASKQIYEEIMRDFRWGANRGYYDTVVRGIPEFFRYYDIRFQPQNQILSMDYSVLVPITEEGVDAIYRYLQYIRLEQEFLRHFSEQSIRNMGEEYHPQYEELYINVCEIVLRYYLKEMLRIQEVRVTEITREELESKLSVYLDVLLKQEFEGEYPLCEMEQLREYLHHSVREIAVEWKYYCT